ncbi:MAG: hypothetical protein ACT4QF_13310 [Sporichthyaceae bacterium]
MDDLRPFDLDAPDPVPSATRPRRNAWQVGLVAGALIVAGAGAGGALAVGSFLSGGGTQPDEIVRGGAMAFARLDMDPAASQKLAVWQLSKKFPDAIGAKAEDGVLREIVGDFFTDDVDGASYERDVEPWLGNRVALVVYPPASATAEPVAAVAAQYTDAAAMDAALKRLDTTDEISWATRDGYVVVSDQEEGGADLLASPTAPALAAQENYRADMAALGGGQLATGWLDLGVAGKALVDAISAEDPQAGDVYNALDADKLTGRIAFGVRAASDHLELVGRTFGVESNGVTQEPGTNLAGSMPADSVAALSFTSLPAAFADAEKQLAGDPEFGGVFDDFLAMTGLDLPKDLAALFGEETALSVGTDANELWGLAARTRGGDASRVEKVVKSMLPDGYEGFFNLQRVSDGFVIASSEQAMRTAAGSGPKLRDDASFRRAVPDAQGAAVVGYLSFPKLVELGLFEDADAEKLEGLEAVGISIGAGENPSFRVRLTTG